MEPICEAPLAPGAETTRRLRVRRLGRVPYDRALSLQESLLGEKVAGDPIDDLLLLEHDAVYTLGRGANEADLMGAPERLGVPVFRIARGGGATFHGPGQLVGYPIVHLRPSGRDVLPFVRALERSLIETCAVFGIEARARQGLTGAWVGDEKIAAIGIGVRHGIAFHGMALNVTTDVTYFARIVPCRMAGLSTTTMERVLGRAPALADVGTAFIRSFARQIGCTSVAEDLVP
jgi:lipoyl(octanoyl) transferase